MILSDFTALVKDEANKGDRLDSAIPLRVQMALRRIERRYTFKYMEAFTTMTLLALAANPRVFTLPDGGIKTMGFLRYPWRCQYLYLTQVDPSEVESNDPRNPTGYWLNGTTEIWFDNTVQQDLALEWQYTAYSALNPIADTNWMLQNGADYLLGETMMLLATRANEPSWATKYQTMRDEAKADMFVADNEYRNADVDARMAAPGERNRRYGRYPGDEGSS